MNINKVNIQKGGRKAYLDLSKLLAMFFVIWGHAAMQSSANHDDAVVTFVGSFHMPLFMIASGMFAKRAMEKSFREILRQKFMQLIWPCLTFGLILFALHCGFHNSLSIKKLVAIELTEYWFLRSLFLCFLISWFVHRLPSKWIPWGCLVSVVASCTINLVGQTVFYVHTMLPFFYLGMLYAKYEECFVKHKGGILLASVFLFAAIFATFYSAECEYNVKFFYHPNAGSFIRYGLCMITGLLGSLAILSVSYILCDKFNMKTLCKIGQYTLGIYLWQKVVLENLWGHFVKHISIFDSSTELYNYIYTPLIAIVMLAFSYFISRTIEESTYASKFFMGSK